MLYVLSRPTLKPGNYLFDGVSAAGLRADFSPAVFERLLRIIFAQLTTRTSKSIFNFSIYHMSNPSFACLRFRMISLEFGLKLYYS